MEKALGWGEPGNSAQRWYANRNGSYYIAAPWCDITITWAASLSGNYDAVCFGNGYAYTVYHAQKANRERRWHWGFERIRRGDIVFSQWEGGERDIGKIDHVEIVTNVTDLYIATIEGNTADKCARRMRVKNSTICGYIRPEYDEEKADADMQLNDSVNVGDTYKNDFRSDKYPFRFVAIGAFAEAKRTRVGMAKLEDEIETKFAEIDTRLDRIENMVNTLLERVQKPSE